jgi:glycosyltransferase involved in cell wall biosynthesis
MKSEKILILTQYFHPENFKSNELAFELAKKGYHVDALVGIPNYLEGKFYKGYGLFSKRHEVINGVNVYRCFQTPRGKGGWRLPFNYFSYVISACLYILFFFIWKKKYNTIIVHEPSPIFQTIPAILYRAIRKSTLYLWVLDLWPESMMSGANVSNNKVLDAVGRISGWIYRHCDKILVSSPLFSKSIEKYSGNTMAVIEYPNWSADMSLIDKSVDILELPEGFKIMMAGNLGGAQDLTSVMDAVERLRDISFLKWIFVGDGSEKKWLNEYIVEHKLENNVFALDRFPANTMPSFFSHADAMLLTLKGGFSHLDATIPARLQSYMSAGKPVVAMIGEGGAKVIRDSQCGYSTDPSNSEELASIIRNKVLTDTEAFAQMGVNGRKYYLTHYTLEQCINHLVQIIENR